MSIDSRLHRIVAAQPYPLLFATISGAHLYGLPSPDSDYDLRGAHVLPLRAVVGLEVRDETVQKEMIVPPHPDSVSGPMEQNRLLTPALSSVEEEREAKNRRGCDPGGALEIDLVSHDVKKFFGLLLKKNGYVLEQLYSPLIVHTTPEHSELKAICNPRQRHLTQPSPRPRRRGGHHQAPFASLLWFCGDAVEAVRQGAPAPGKAVALRLSRAAHGHSSDAHRRDQCEPRRPERGGASPYIADLIARKQSGENTKLEDADVAFHQREYERLRAELQAAHDASKLPEVPSDETRKALNDLLVRIRLRNRR